MSLNRTDGEQIEGLEGPFRVVPARKWFETSLFDAAAGEAARKFRAAGWGLSISFDEDQVLVQEYPRTRQLAMIFQMRIRGQDTYYVHVFALPPEMIANLKASNLWDDVSLDA